MPNRPPDTPHNGERALRDMRSLWPVPTFVLAAVVALLSLARHVVPFWLLASLWGALAIFVATFLVYNRRAVHLADDLHRRAELLAASRDHLEILNAQSAELAATNARLYEDSLRYAANLRLLAQKVAEAAASTQNPARVAAPVAEQAVALLGCAGAGVYLLSEDARALIPLAACPEGANSALPLQAPLLRDSFWKSADPLVVEDARVFGEGWDTFRGLLAAPLRAHGQGGGVTGALVLHWDMCRVATQEEAGLAAALAGFAAAALQNARLAAVLEADRQELSEKNARLLEETERRGQELRALVRRVGDALAAGHSPERVARLVAEQARRMIPCRRAVFGVMEEGSPENPQMLIPLAIADDEPDTWVSDGWSLADYPFLEAVLHRPNPVFLSDVASDGRLTPRERAALRRADVSAMLLAPARGRGDRPLGLLVLAWPESGVAVSAEQFEIAGVLAGQAASALENARLHQDLERTEGQLTAQLAAAQAARDFVQGVLQNVPAAVLVLSADEDLLIQNANALAEAMPDPHLQRDGLAGRRLADVFPGLEDLLRDALDRAARRGELSTLTDVEYRGFTRGTTFWTFSITPQRDAESRRVAQVILLALETTDRIRLLRENQENAHREQQRATELDATLRSLGDGVVTCDSEGRLASVNRAGQAILSQGVFVPGEAVASWAGRVSLCYASGQTVPPNAVPLMRVLRTAQALEPQEYSITTQEGERRLIELTATPVLAPAPMDMPLPGDAVVVSGAVAVFRDVTALRQSQAQEAAANRRVESLVDISRRLNATQQLEEIFMVVVEGARALLPAVPDLRAMLYEMEGETRSLGLRAMLPEARSSRRPPQSLQETLPYQVPFDASSPLLWPIYVSRAAFRSDDLAADSKPLGAGDSLALRGGIASLPMPRSALALPLVARDAVVGHLALTSSAPEAFADPRLMDALTNLSALAVIARANALLYQQTSQKVQELNALWTVGEATASKLELTEVVDTLTEQVRAVMSGEACTLSLFEGGGDTRSLRLQGTIWREWTLGGEQASRRCRFCDQVTEEAAAAGEPVSLVGQENAEFPLCRWRALAGQSGRHSVLAVPLRFGDETLGALTVWVRGDRPFAPSQIKLLRTLATFAVAAVRNAQSYAHEQHIAETLQKSFLPDTRTEMAGLDIAERYYPARTEEARIGGDYYDFIPLGPARLAVVIGDISGKGLAAAVYTAMAKYTLRAFAAQDASPVEVLTRANRAIARHTTGEIFSTLFYGVLDLSAGTLTYVNAGHEPPLLARADGTLTALLPTGLMLGAFADAEWEQEQVSFGSGDTLALYTDGLPDARAEDGTFWGEEGIRAALQAARAGSAAQVADSLHAAAVQFAAGKRLRDDVALLALKAV